MYLLIIKPKYHIYNTNFKFKIKKLFISFSYHFLFGAAKYLGSKSFVGSIFISNNL
jgi:hypothetical protein